eukprot:g8958.t2
MDESADAGMKERNGIPHHYTSCTRGNEVTPDRDSMVNPAAKRARRRLETDNDNGSDDADDIHAHDWGTNHNGDGRLEESTASTAQLLSESIIELLHVCTLIQVELNNNSTNTSDQTDEYERIKQEASDSSSHAQGP